ncbi:MAG: hypothetical protein WC890_02425 [Candidatus Margulisiibacteriota bacterium]
MVNYEQYIGKLKSHAIDPLDEKLLGKINGRVMERKYQKLAAGGLVLIMLVSGIYYFQKMPFSANQGLNVAEYVFQAKIADNSVISEYVFAN